MTAKYAQEVLQNFNSRVKRNYKCLHSQFKIDAKCRYSTRSAFRKGMHLVISLILFLGRKTLVLYLCFMIKEFEVYNQGYDN